ncbi:MAG: N-acetyl-gamma-glutamyl-phosphate reductase [Thermoanaerobaculia bacterium]
MYLHAFLLRAAGRKKGHALIRTAIVGASGYSGAELVGLLAGHPGVELAAICAAGSAGERWEELYPGREHLFRGEIQPFEAAALAGLDAVFLALPHGASAGAARRLRGRVGCVLDLSGDLRLADADTYRRWYGGEHPAPELLGEAVYGLPELFGDSLPGAELISCAGCYATVSQLAAAPALALEGSTAVDVVVTAISGTSGAGRKAELELSFSEIFGDLRAYRVGHHQHAPEIAQGLSRHAGRQVRVTFVPHLAPIERGIAATVVLGGETAAAGELLAAYNRAYETAPFVRVRDPAVTLPAVRHVAGTNFCDLAPVQDEAGGSVVVVGVIDNLLKGAAGQAVQLLNLAFGLPETQGLLAGEAAGAA